MNFIDILRVASENQGVAEREIKKPGYTTSLGKARRDKRDKPKGVKSAAVQAFLRKKEDEEKEKIAEAKRKKAELMKLRAEQNTLGKMNNIIKRNHTKEAIFEVEGNESTVKESSTATPGASEENDNDVSFTRLRTETGSVKRRAVLSNVKRVQVNPHFVPKEEREKAESEEKSKSSEKHSSSHDSKHSSSSSSKSSHSNDKHQSKHDGKSRDKHKHDRDEGHDKPEKSKPEVKKKRPPAPPPMSFNDLLKIAEQKKNQEPAMNKPKDTKDKDKQKKDPAFDRPMTQEEKDRIMRKKSKEYQFWLKTGRRHPDSDIAKPKHSGKLAKNRPNTQQPPSPTEDKAERTLSSSGNHSKSTHNHSSSSSQNTKTVNGAYSSGSSSKSSNSSTTKPSNSSYGGSNKSSSSLAFAKHSASGSNSGGKSGLHNAASSKSSTSDNYKNSRTFDSNSKKLKLPSNGARSEEGRPSSASKSSARPQPSASHKGAQSPRGAYAEENENVLVCGPSREREEKPRPQDRPQESTWDRIYGSMHSKQKHQKLKELAARKRRVIESDEESDYDDMDGFLDDEGDDMDDFIDDSEANNVSKEIAAIFGYDRRRYRDVDDDDCRDMEANFAQIEREEKISARIGLKEDLEDIRREEEELKRKALLKKQRAKKMKMR